MRLLSLLSTLFLFCIGVQAQIVRDLFIQRPQLSRDFHRVTDKYQSLQLNAQELGMIRNTLPERLELNLPFENKVMQLKLTKTSITSEQFQVIEALPGGSRRTVNYEGAVFYQGKIEGAERSIATFSIFNNQVMGVISDSQSNIVIGAIENNGIASNEYAMYRDRDLLIPNPFHCETGESPIPAGDGIPTTANTPATANQVTFVGEPVDIYFECDNKFYTDKGSSTNNVVNYVLGFFNNTAQIYSAENIKIQVSQILVWTTQDPEAAGGFNTTSTVLNSFSGRMASATYSGDYAHFLSTRSLGGGIAYLLGSPCVMPQQFRTGVSAIYNTYNDFPTYSWTIEVVTHELGHNLGSNHTQWCGWTGGALDNCYTTEGGCAAGPAPTNGGTIMSYCHLTGYGINFSNGFGQQPGDKIRTVVSNSTCFGNCKMTLSISKTDASCGLNNGSATVTATNGTGALTYLWSNGQTTATLTNVGPGTYNVKVTDAAGCQVLAYTTLVNNGSSLSATLTPSTPTPFCTGSPVLLTASFNAAYTYQWYKDAVAIGGATSNTYTASSTGTYSVLIAAGACNVTPSVAITEVPVPIATITAGGPTTFCSGGSVNLNATTGAGYTYIWYNNAVVIGGATNSSYSATASGSYTVRVSGGTCQSTSSATVVTVNATPAATISAGGPTSFCTGGSVTLNANTGAGLTYQWYNNAVAIGGATNSSYTANGSGSYTVIVTGGSCPATSSATVVTVNTNPSATISAAGSTTFCSGGSVTLNANTGAGLTYQWFNNAVSIGGANNSSYSATASGSYTVMISNGSCQTTSAATVVTVNATPASTISAAGPTTFCSGGSVTLNANTGAGYTYQWYNNAVAIGGATNSTYTANGSGSYTVIVTGGSCSATSSATVVTVNTNPPATISAAGSTTFCSGGSVTLNANTGAGLTYQWFNNAVSIGGANNSSYSATASGSYTVMISNGPCQTTSAATVVTVNATPASTISAAGPTTFCSGGSVTLNANTGAGYTYQWYNAGLSVAGANNSSFVATLTGNYTVKVISGSCETISSPISISVNATPAAQITAGGPTVICVGSTATLNANTGSGYTYIWYKDGVVIDNAMNASYGADVSGDYTVSVTSGSCFATSSPITVSVNPAPQAAVQVSGATSFCAGGSVSLQATAGNGYTYQWYKDGALLNGVNQQTYAPTTSGDYTVNVILGTCASLSNATIVTVLANPVVTVSPATVTIQKFQTQTITATGGSSYNWNIQPALVSQSANSAVFMPLTTTSYSIEGTDINGCKSTASATITVVGCGDVTNISSSVQSPSRAVLSWTNPAGVSSDTIQYRKSGSGIWNKLFVTWGQYALNGLEPGTLYEYNIIPLCNTTSVYFESASRSLQTPSLPSGVFLKLYPNPVKANSQLEVIVDKPFTLDIGIFNNMGQKVMTVATSENLSAGQFLRTIDPALFKPGVYHMAVTVNGKLYNLKMVVAP